MTELHRNSPALPALFVPHGAPTFILAPGEAGADLRLWAAENPRPSAIIILSAHWNTARPTLGQTGPLDTIHDFWGFPEELYRLRYPAQGSAAHAARVGEVLSAAGLPLLHDAGRGLDHGAWTPLLIMYPEADIPVIPLSLPAHGGAAAALALGRALAPLRAEGYLIMGSGSVTHNLADYQQMHMSGSGTPAYVRRFADWVNERLSAGELDALADYRQLSPDGVRAHPSEEHLMPLFAALGAAGAAPVADRFHTSIADGVIAMDAYAFTGNGD